MKKYDTSFTIACSKAGWQLWMKDHRWMWTQQGVFPYLWKHYNPPTGTTCSDPETDNRCFTSGGGLPPQQASPKACGNAKSMPPRAVKGWGVWLLVTFYFFRLYLIE